MTSAHNPRPSRATRLTAAAGATAHLAVCALLCATLVGPAMSALRPDIRTAPSTTVDHFTPEGLVSIGGAAFFLLQGRFTAREAGDLPVAMWNAYDEMGPAPSLVVSELTGGEGRDLWIDPGGEPAVGVVFLHGYGGNFTLNCWQFAQAAPDAITVCPSLGVSARWHTRQGREIIRERVAQLRAHGVETVILAGLSKGAIGASIHARSLHRDIDGLVLVSGVSGRARPPGVPTLLVHGRQDTWTPRGPAVRLARRAGRDAQLNELEGGHFLFLQKRAEVRNQIESWLSKHSANPSSGQAKLSRQ